MPRVRLTDRTVRGLETDRSQETWWDAKVPGFGVRVSGKTGRKSWVVRYRANGTRRRVTLGTYPTVSLADARDRARATLYRVEVEGEDPAAEPERDLSFREAADAHLEEATGHRFRERRARRIKRAFEKDVYPVLGGRPVAEVGRRDVSEVLSRIVGRGSPHQATAVKTMMAGVFSWALDRELVETNPARAVRSPASTSRRERVLRPSEVRELWHALEAEPQVAAGVVRLRLITGQRGAEIRRMRHRDVGGDTWIIPPEAHKADKRHAVPLSGPALDVLAGLEPLNAGGEYVFPSPRREAQPIGRLGSLLERLREAVSFEDWQFRDLRRTVATRMAEDLKISRLHIAKVLGHEVPGVTGVYDRASYEAEKREALERWGRRLMEIVEGDDDAG